MYVTERFILDVQTQDYIHSLVPPFGYNGFGEFIFYRTYSRNIDGYQENWADCVLRVTAGVFSLRKDWYIKNHIYWNENLWQAYARAFAESMFRMQWMPPGRGLWAMGTDFVYERGSMALQNCFRGSVKFITDQGTKTFAECNGQKVNVRDINGFWREAEVKNFGSQKLKRIFLKPIKRSNLTLSYDVTSNHRWVLADGTETTYLRPGDQIKVSPSNDGIDFESQEYIDGFAHGAIFGDGCQIKKYPERYIIRLCGKKNETLYRPLINSSAYRCRTQQPANNGDFTITLVTKEKLKETPENKSLTYIRGFVDGWLATDGGKRANSLEISSQDNGAIDWLIENGPVVGYVVTGINTESNMVTNYGQRKNSLKRVILRTSECIFKVTDYKLLDVEEEVYCVVEPVTGTFTLAGGVPTGNCGYTNLGRDLGTDISWLMDSLMCVPDTTWTLTSEGPRKISELVDTPCTLIVDGKYYKTTGFFFSGEKEVFEVETIQGYKFEATGNHKFFVDYNGQKIWQEVSNLVIGDKIQLNQHNIEWDGEGTFEEGYLLGWLYGDGTVSRHKSDFLDIKLYAYPDDYCVLDYIAKCFLQYPNILYSEGDEAHTEHYVVYSKELNSLCEKFEVSTDKSITEKIEKASSDFVEGFLSALFDTDGGVTSKDAVITFSQSNKERIYAVQRMLLRLGIKSSIHLDRLAGLGTIRGRIVNQANKYVLRIGKKINTDRFMNRVGFRNPNKRQKLQDNERLLSRRMTDDFTVTVKSITSLGLKKVYDVTVPDVHAFDANGFLAHNCGVGVGFGPIRDDNLQIYTPIGEYDFEIPDTREGWALSEKLLIDAFIYPGYRLPVFKYNKIRPAGIPIKGFGGIASGPEPLKKLHTETIKQFQLFKTRPQYDSVYLKTNLANLTGCCVVAGNVRRSAELAKGKMSDPTFKNLKDYELYPEREAFGWMSNNSVALESDDDFDHLGEIAARVIRNGEPGYINMRNLQYGRIGKDMDGLRFDEAIGLNPCGRKFAA